VGTGHHGLPVPRKDDGHFVAKCNKFTWQSSDHIGQATGFYERCGFGGDHQNSGHPPDCRLFARLTTTARAGNVAGSVEEFVARGF
jgi:hypothetical protein